jgi:hypothetical protein
MDLVLTAALINGVIHSNNLSGLDHAWIDANVAHEYTHHLQFERSSTSKDTSLPSCGICGMAGAGGTTRGIK